MQEFNAAVEIRQVEDVRVIEVYDQQFMVLDLPLNLLIGQEDLILEINLCVHLLQLLQLLSRIHPHQLSETYVPVVLQAVYLPMPLADLAVSEHLEERFQVEAGLEVGLELLAVVLVHAVHNGLPSHLVSCPPLLLGALQPRHHLLTSAALQTKLVEVYGPCFHLRYLLEVALESVELTPVLHH